LENLDLIEKMRLILRHEVLYFSLDRPRQQETLDALKWLESEENCQLVLSGSSHLPKRVWSTRTFAKELGEDDIHTLSDVVLH
jgi:hypothetical protein